MGLLSAHHDEDSPLSPAWRRAEPVVARPNNYLPLLAEKGGCCQPQTPRIRLAEDMTGPKSYICRRLLHLSVRHRAD